MELAQDGTLFLDEIGEIPLHLQAKLLRVLEERALRRVGGNRWIPLRVRIIAATNRDLADLVRRGRFRKDLYYRLHVIPITIPPLRKRKEDISLLAAHFLREFCTRPAVRFFLFHPRLSFACRHTPGREMSGNCKM